MANSRRRVRRQTLAVLILLFQYVAVGGQAPSPTDAFQPLAFLIGEREGTSEGRPGKGNVRREYSRALNGRFNHGRD